MDDLKLQLHILKKLLLVMIALILWYFPRVLLTNHDSWTVWYMFSCLQANHSANLRFPKMHNAILWQPWMNWWWWCYLVNASSLKCSFLKITMSTRCVAYIKSIFRKVCVINKKYTMYYINITHVTIGTFYIYHGTYSSPIWMILLLLFQKDITSSK